MKQILLGLWLTIASVTSVFAAWNGSSIEGSKLGTQWEVIDTQGNSRTAQTIQGKVSLFFFGFTQCPDICPTTLATISQIFSLLNESQRKDVQIIMVSVDPERDTVEVLKQYLSYFPGNIIGFTGSEEQIKTMQKSFKVFSRKVPIQDGKSYTVEHSSNLYLFDKQGKPRLFYYSDVAPEKLAQDVEALLNE
ncbi:SCO family protein [Pelistega indica]|uniref:SCO family protein n=1 Tax=Pelistega indica TaxID=1414851 RepID=UPI00138AC413|nr:SCO family protein [Pelistega indica]